MTLADIQSAPKDTIVSRINEVEKTLLPNAVSMKERAVNARSETAPYLNSNISDCRSKTGSKKAAACDAVTNRWQPQMDSWIKEEEYWGKTRSSLDAELLLLKEQLQKLVAAEQMSSDEVARELAKQRTTKEAVFNETSEAGVTDRFEIDLDKEARQQAMLMQADADASKKKITGYAVMAVALTVAVIGIVFIVKKFKKQA